MAGGAEKRPPVAALPDRVLGDVPAAEVAPPPPALDGLREAPTPIADAVGGRRMFV